MSMTLYAANLSSATPVVHALKELEAPCEIVWLDLRKNEQKKPEFLALNPNGKVPTLIVDGTPMFEALAIMQWLGERFGVERGLWPTARSADRMTALAWSTWAYVTYGSALVRLNFASNERMPRELHNPAQVTATLRELGEFLTILDERLTARPYLLGEAFSLVDLIVASTVTYGTYLGASVKGHQHVKMWQERFQARPAYQATWAGAPAPDKD
jgi:glutathione S-transferase